jgi:hypothetical protein
MSSVQTLRHILMAGAAFAAVLGLLTGQMLVAVIMGLGFLAHLALSVHLRRTGAIPPPQTGTPAPPTHLS